MARTKPHSCPCASERPYRACCAPYHRGAEPPDPPALVRSRYSAFALKEVDYLWRTLDAENAERVMGQEAYARGIRGSALRYTGLILLDSAPEDQAGVAQVLFLAKVFERGRDQSFVELSDFRHDGVGWRYIGGLTARATPGASTGLTIETFRARAST